MLIDDGICENCLAKNYCDVLPYSNNCNEVRAMAKHDKQVYNKAVDDLLGGMNQITYNCQDADELFEKICDLAEQLKAGGVNGKERS